MYVIKFKSVGMIGLYWIVSNNTSWICIRAVSFVKCLRLYISGEQMLYE